MIIPRVVTLILMLFSSTIAEGPLWQPPAEPVAGASQSNFFPVFGSDAGEFIGLSFTNTAVVVNEVTVTWTDADGIRNRTGFLSLAPGSQRAALARDIFRIPEDPTDGWIRIDYSASGLLSYMTSGCDGILDGAEPASVVSTRIMLPHVAVDTGFLELAYTDTLVYLVNPGTAAANARAELIGLDGLFAGDLAVSIPARGSHTLRISEAFRAVLPPNHAGGRTFRGYFRVSSDTGLAGWLRIDTPLSRRLLRGRGEEEIVPSRLMMVGHFASGSPTLYRSELNVVNAGDALATLELVAQDNRGERIGQAVRRTLKPGQAFREDVLSLFRVVLPAVFPPPMLDGYIRIRAADGGMFQAVGDIDIICGDNAASMLYPIGPASSFDAILPFVISGADYFTGYAIANPNELLTVQLDVGVELLDRDGRPVGFPRKISLSPSARFVSLIEEKVRSGYLRIHANGPFAVVGSIGSQSGSMLAQLPGLP